MTSLFKVLLTLPVLFFALMPSAEKATPSGDGSAGSSTVADEDGFQQSAHVEEARARARLLHETIHGVLQVVHRDFFREDENLPIPSHSLEDVFEELGKTYDVRLRWLVVNAIAMNIDNNPADEFERNAVKELASGAKFFDDVAEKEYRYAGPILLSSQCLKCHLPSRTSNKEKLAGLVIRMPLGE